MTTPQDCIEIGNTDFPDQAKPEAKRTFKPADLIRICPEGRVKSIITRII